MGKKSIEVWMSLPSQPCIAFLPSTFRNFPTCESIFSEVVLLSLQSSIKQPIPLSAEPPCLAFIFNLPTPLHIPATLPPKHHPSSNNDPNPNNPTHSVVNLSPTPRPPFSPSPQNPGLITIAFASNLHWKDIWGQDPNPPHHSHPLLPFPILGTQSISASLAPLFPHPRI